MVSELSNHPVEEGGQLSEAMGQRACVSVSSHFIPAVLTKHNLGEKRVHFSLEFQVILCHCGEVKILHKTNLGYSNSLNKKM